eukprot:1637806-Lingulodinium_polyedra.AAC.1
MSRAAQVQGATGPSALPFVTRRLPAVPQMPGEAAIEAAAPGDIPGRVPIQRWPHGDVRFLRGR